MEAEQVNGANGSVLTLLDILPAGTPTASQVMARHEFERAFQVALNILPEDHATAIRLRYLERQKLAQIAETLGKSKAAVRSILGRARRKLREALGRPSTYTTVR